MLEKSTINAFIKRIKEVNSQARIFIYSWDNFSILLTTQARGRFLGVFGDEHNFMELTNRDDGPNKRVVYGIPDETFDAFIYLLKNKKDEDEEFHMTRKYVILGNIPINQLPECINLEKVRYKYVPDLINNKPSTMNIFLTGDPTHDIFDVDNLLSVKRSIIWE